MELRSTRWNQKVPMERTGSVAWRWRSAVTICTGEESLGSTEELGRRWGGSGGPASGSGGDADHRELQQLPLVHGEGGAAGATTCTTSRARRADSPVPASAMAATGAMGVWRVEEMESGFGH